LAQKKGKEKSGGKGRGEKKRLVSTVSFIQSTGKKKRRGERETHRDLLSFYPRHPTEGKRKGVHPVRGEKGGGAGHDLLCQAAGRWEKKKKDMPNDEKRKEGKPAFCSYLRHEDERRKKKGKDPRHDQFPKEEEKEKPANPSHISSRWYSGGKKAPEKSTKGRALPSQARYKGERERKKKEGKLACHKKKGVGADD